MLPAGGGRARGLGPTCTRSRGGSGAPPRSAGSPALAKCPQPARALARKRALARLRGGTCRNPRARDGMPEKGDERLCTQGGLADGDTLRARVPPRPPFSSARRFSSSSAWWTRGYGGGQEGVKRGSRGGQEGLGGGQKGVKRGSRGGQAGLKRRARGGQEGLGGGQEG
eukprot:1026661-Prorocentrum_minimum.AAC.1